MLTYSLASNAAPRVNFDEVYSRAFNGSRPGAGVKPLRSDSRFENLQPPNGRARPLPDPKIGRVNSHALGIAPANAVSRRASAWDGIKVEIVQSVTHDEIEFRFRAPCHLLRVCAKYWRRCHGRKRPQPGGEWVLAEASQDRADRRFGRSRSAGNTGPNTF